MPSPIRRAFWLFAFVLMPVPGWAGPTLRIEVVDDTGGTNSPYILLVGTGVTGPNNNYHPMSIQPDGGQLAWVDTASSPNPTVPLPITSLQSAGYQVQSPYTGAMRDVYYFNVTTLGSGVFMVFQNDGPAPFTYQNGVNPSPSTANYRFDQCEITFDRRITSGANLTSIDAFSMPMQFELFNGTAPNLTLVDQRKYYLSLESMLAAFRAVGAGAAIYGVDTTGQLVPGWTAGGPNTFVRALGPGQAAAASTAGDPSPYPSFAAYLAGLVASGYTFTLDGSANSNHYKYTGVMQDDGNGGYQISLKGRLRVPAAAPLVPNPKVTVQLPLSVPATATPTVLGGAITSVAMNIKGAGYHHPPKVIINGIGTGALATATVSNKGKVTGITVSPQGTGYDSSTTISIDPPAGSMDTFLYGATLSADAFAVEGMSYDTLAANTNIVFGAIARDALAAINFGYMNGIYGNDSRNWYGTAPTDFPFGLARQLNDGYYNPWAAILYNNSDAYGFAFSDRSGPSPLMLLSANNVAADVQTLRITLLPDSRLDSPKPVATPTASTIALQWAEVANATSYQVDVLAPSGVPSATVTAVAGTNSYTLTNLVAGAPHTIKVSALAMSGANQLVSPAQPIQCSTMGTAPISTGSEGFLMSMSWQPGKNIASPPSVNFNGQTLNYSTTTKQWLTPGGLNASLAGNTSPVGAPQPNQYVMTLTDHNNNVLFTNIISVVLTDAGNGQFNLASASLYGNAPLTVGSAGPYYPTSDNGQTQTNKLVLQVPFNPTPLKAFTEVTFPIAGIGYAQWAAGIPGFTDNAPDADPDGDGISNLMEYLQGSDPMVPGTFDMTSTELTPTEVQFTYRRSLTATGVTLGVEWSTDLQTWTSTGVSYGPSQIVGNNYEATAYVPLAGNAAIFTRLRVTLDTPPPGRGIPAAAANRR
jgi:hypothetical protein